MTSPDLAVARVRSTIGVGRAPSGLGALAHARVGERPADELQAAGRAGRWAACRGACRRPGVGARGDGNSLLVDADKASRKKTRRAGRHVAGGSAATRREGGGERERVRERERAPRLRCRGLSLRGLSLLVEVIVGHECPTQTPRQIPKPPTFRCTTCMFALACPASIQSKAPGFLLDLSLDT